MHIYKITNLINGKIYIGKEKGNNINYFGSGVLINKAIKKYGREHFQKEILQECSLPEELNNLEIYWIKKLNSRDRNIGYNLTDGGDGLINPDEITKSKLSVFCKDKTWEELYGLKKAEEMKKNLKESIENNPNFGMRGKKHSLEFRQKSSDSHKGQIPWNKHKNNIYSDETRKQMGAKNIGKLSHIKNKTYEDRYGDLKAKEIKTKIGLSNKKPKPKLSEIQKGTTRKTYKLISPENILYTIKGLLNLKNFCNEHLLSKKGIYLLVRNKTQNYKKWKKGT